MNAVTDLAEVDNGTHLAVVQTNGQIERWLWEDGVMQKDGNRLPPFFFSGLLRDNKVMLGNFAPPQRGEWFRYQSRAEFGWLIVAVLAENRYSTIHFRRGNFYDWREMSQDDLFATCVRTEAPEWVTQPYVDMAYRAHEERTARLAQEQQARNLRDARTNMTYARDYLTRAIELTERRT